MDVEEMPNCCGIEVLYDFPFSNPAPNPPTKMYLDRVRKERKKVAIFLEDVEFDLRYSKGRSESMMMANLNSYQLKALRPVFKAAGWSIPKAFYHTAHKSQITILTKALYPEGAKTKDTTKYTKWAAEKKKIDDDRYKAQESYWRG